MSWLKTIALIITVLVTALAGPPAYADDPTPTPSPTPSPVSPPIEQKYESMGGAHSRLGAPVGLTRCGLRNDGCVRMYKMGYIAWSPNTGAWAIIYHSAAKWEHVGSENGPLGYPTSDETPAPNGAASALVQYFEGGEMWWSPGMWVVTGEPYAHWSALGRSTGPLGIPRADEACGLRAAGCAQRFDKGAIYRSSETGTHAVHGVYQAAYDRAGGLDGSFAYPTTDEVCGLRAGGCYQNFQGGAVLNSQAGAYFCKGAIRGEWARLGFETGRLGYPASDEVCGLKDGGCYQNFQGGAILWSPATGAHNNLGAIRGKYAELGFENGRLGYPTSDEVCAETGCRQHFQGGTIEWSPATGAYLR